MTSSFVVRVAGRYAVCLSALALVSCAQPQTQSSAPPPPAATKPSAPIGDSAAMATAAAAMQSAGADHPGKAIYARTCAACHDKPEATRSPSFDTLRSMRAETITYALTQGKMQTQAASLSAADRATLQPTSAATTDASGVALVALDTPEPAARIRVGYVGGRRGADRWSPVAVLFAPGWLFVEDERP